MGLSLKKYQPLPDLTVQGNNYQAPNIALPAPNAPAPGPAISVGGNTAYYRPPQGNSWSQPAPVHPTLPVGPFQSRYFGGSLVNPFLNSPYTIATGLSLAHEGDLMGGVGEITKGFLEGPASLVPVGKGASLAVEGGRVLPRMVAGAKLGAKISGLYGVAHGASSAVSQGQNPKNVAKQALTEGATDLVGGTVLGTAAPLAGEATRQTTKVTLKTAKAIQKYDRAQNEAGAVGKNINKPNVPEVPKKNMRMFEYNDTPMTEGEKKALAELEASQINTDYTSAANELRRLANESGQSDLYKKVMGVVSDQKMSQKDAMDFIKQGLAQMRDSGTNAKIRMGIKDTNTPPPSSGLLTQPTQGVKPKATAKFPTEAEFNKMIPAVKGTPVQGALAEEALSPAEKTALVEQTTKGIRLAPQEANTARNPYKSPLPAVEAGNYKGAIQNSQLVSRPIETAGSLWQHAMKRLNPDEQTNFWRAVEEPSNPNHSPQLQTAINLWRQADNMVHGHSQALGGNTNYLTDHALHPWQLPEEYTQHVINGGSPSKFTGLNNISRKYRTIADAPTHMQLGTDPVGEGSRYLQANAAILRKEALKQGLAQADSHEVAKGHTLPLGGDHTVPLSKKGIQAAKSLQPFTPTENKAVVSLRTVNQGIKSTVLSLGQFHTINIGALRAAPTLIMRGHPAAAAKGLYGMFRGAFGSKYADRVIGNALKDGTVDKAAQIGMPYGGSGYDVSGTFLKHGVGSRTVFGKQIPMMHDQVVRSIIKDLERKKIPLNSPQAREAGLAGANLMGELNRELQNISPRTQRYMTDAMLAGQFTPSKFIQLKRATTKGGVGGSYARANVVANVAATTAIIAGIGYITKQKSDDLKDMLLRALVDPAAPTSSIDSKGNNVKLRTPGTDTSDIAKLLGIKLVRNSDGHLGVSWHGLSGRTAADFGKARLSPLLSAGVKVLTNENFSNKPLYDPNAPGGTKTEQAATSVLLGDLPIGLQGLPQTDAVKKHLPGNVQDVLNAQKPGGNPLVKSIGSSFGLTPSTDQTVGKAKESSTYFNNLDNAKKGLNSHELAALELYAGSKKNPVTGKYNVEPNVNDSSAKAKALLDQPKVIDHLITMNAALAKQGSKTDPLWGASKDQITKTLQYQAMPPGGADKKHWYAQNKDWYGPLSDQRTAFFDSLPKGDPNKPAAPIEFPKASADTAAKQEQFFNIEDSAQRAKFLQDNPDVQTQLDKQVEYNNKMRVAQGYGQLDSFPKASADVQKIISEYNALPKHDGPKGGSKTRSLWIQSHPKQYAAMTDYFTQASVYSLEGDAAQAQFKDTGLSQKGLKDIYNLGQYDVGKYTDDNGNVFYALSGGASSSSGSSSSGKSYITVNGKRYSSGGSSSSSGSNKVSQFNPNRVTIKLSSGGKVSTPSLSVPKGKAKVTKKVAATKPKVSLKSLKT